MDLGGRGVGGPGDAQMEFEFGTRGAVRVAVARIEMTSYRWPKMSAYDQGAMRQQYRATLWHEIGHLVTARNSIATAVANNVKPSVALAQINADQNAYDDLTDHGIRQDLAPPPLGGANTVIECR
jgi:hypothetical protein